MRPYASFMSCVDHEPRWQAMPQSNTGCYKAMLAVQKAVHVLNSQALQPLHSLQFY